MAEAFRRHDLVRADPAAWTAWLAGRPDLGGVPHVAGWAAAGYPLIVRRRVPGETGELIPLGLPLPPADGKRRIGLALPPAALTRVVPISLADAVAQVPAPWRASLAALTALGHRHGIAPRPFGSLLWQAFTGLTYLSPTSDLDLLWPCRLPVPGSLLDGIAAVAETAPMGIDGEILLPDGTGLHWRELRDAPQDGSILAKGLDRLDLRPVAPLRHREPA
ncbi:malonate decarboxylase holo-[acyl-carrier-protein] synthase [Methylobacterium phyllosphaerae]